MHIKQDEKSFVEVCVQTGEVMRLFKYFIVLTLLISAKNSFAYGAYAGASAYAGIGGPIPGQWGGMQACPYMSGGRGVSGIESLEAQLEKIDEDIEAFQEEQEELIDGSHERYGEDRVPFKKGVAKGLVEFLGQESRKEFSYCDEAVNAAQGGAGIPQGAVELAELLKTSSANYTQYCVEATSRNYVFDTNTICGNPAIYLNTEKMDRKASVCRKVLDRYDALEQKIIKAEKARDKLENKLDKLVEKQEDAEDAAFESGRPLPPEGVQCLDCIGYPEPQAPGWKQILSAGAVDLLNAGVWYAGTKYVSKNNAKLGWATPPLAMGLPGAHATASLFANAYGGGMGAGSWGCSPGAGYHWGPNGVYGNPFGGMSPYGACGGAFAGPCGGPGGGAGFGGGFNLGMGGGIYAPGVGMGGMAGPWGGGGMYPNPYGMGGIGVGGGIGIGGMAGMGGMYPGMGGMGGMFPGAYPGPYGVGIGGGIGIGGMGGLGGMGGMGGMFPGMGGYPMGGIGGGIGGGMGFPGMGGMNPYGGFGGPFGGIGGGMGMGGPMGGMFPGMGGPMGGMGGMGMGGLGGMDMQMQMMQMQMQQYQAYYQAQQRAFQNQQAVTQQLYGLQSEYMQIQQRYQYLMMQLYSSGGGMGMGGGFGGSIGIGGGIGGGPGMGGGPGIPVGNPSGPVPAR